jgi:hypothetical protein
VLLGGGDSVGQVGELVGKFLPLAVVIGVDEVGLDEP